MTRWTTKYGKRMFHMIDNQRKTSGEAWMAIGWVYVLTNADMPNLIKIGQSASDPDLRSNELFTTGVPSPFVVAYKGLYDDYARLERLVHADLAADRHNTQREFFRLDVKSAVAAIRRLAASSPKYEEAVGTNDELTQAESSRSAAASARSHVQVGGSDAVRRAFVAGERLRRRKRRLLSLGFVEFQNEVFPACPECSQAVRVPKGKHLLITCPKCSHRWKVPT